MIGSTVVGYLPVWFTTIEFCIISGEVGEVGEMGEVGDVGLDAPFDVDFPTEKGLLWIGLRLEL